MITSKGEKEKEDGDDDDDDDQEEEEEEEEKESSNSLFHSKENVGVTHEKQRSKFYKYKRFTV